MLNSIWNVSKRLTRSQKLSAWRNFSRNLNDCAHKSQNAADSQESRLLNALNDINDWKLCRTVLTKKHFELIQQWKNENGGSITNFNDLTKIAGITKETIESLRAFCTSQINDTNDHHHHHHHQTTIQNVEYMSDAEHFSNDFVQIENNRNFIIYDENIPAIDLTPPNYNRSSFDRFRSIRLVLEPKLKKLTSIKSFTAIYQEAAGISIAKFSHTNGWNDTIRIDDWAHYGTSGLGLKTSWQICEQFSKIVAQLPDSDVYLIDNHIKAQRFHKSIVPKKLIEIVQINQLCAILMALLHQKCVSNEKDDGIYFMEYKAVGKLFKLTIRNETVSTQPTIKNILHGDDGGKCLVAPLELKIDVSDELKRIYHKSHPAERECLGRSMLIGLTFIRLGILKNT